jgi:acetyltransferase-like isoleucine patch superfamily enzyme
MAFRYFKRYLSTIFNFFYWWLKSIKLNLKIDSLNISRDCKFEGENQIRQGVSIGKGCFFGKNTYVSGPNTTIHSASIGRYCSIAMGVKIGLEDHDYKNVTTHPILYSSKFGNLTKVKNSIQKKKPPVIEDDVWIGCNAIILRGVNVGKGSIIASGSVVTKDVCPYSIVAGVPAKLISTRFEPSQITELKEINWCTWSDDYLTENIEYFSDVDAFISKF